MARLAQLKIDYSVMFALLVRGDKEAQVKRHMSPTMPQLPDDVRFVDVRDTYDQRCLTITVESSAFDELPALASPPVIMWMTQEGV